MRVIRIAALALAAAVAGTARAAVSQETLDGKVSSFEDIQYWLGSGTNKVAVVFDFHDGSKDKTAFAWGYRWNGDAPSMKTIVDAIVADDPRLHSFISSSSYGSFVDAFGYDADEDGGAFERVYDAESWSTVSVASDEDDIFPSPESYSDANEYGGFTYMGTSWLQLWGSGDAIEDVEWSMTPNGIDGTYPENGKWVCWRFSDYVTDYDGDWNVVGEEYYFTPINDVYIATRGFYQKDVTYWVGSGTNQAAVVVDYGAGMDSYVWGVRWNGVAPTLKEAFDAIAADDPRFTSQISSSGWVTGFRYDTMGDGEVVLDPRSDYDYAEDFSYMTGHDWAAMTALNGAQGASFAKLDWELNEVVATGVTLENGGWYSQKYRYYEMSLYPPYDYLEESESAVPATPANALRMMRFADVKFWVGNGANETVLVFDFNDGSVEHCSFAWGYRWNGEAPTLETIVNAIAAADSRFNATISQGAWGGFVENFSYDHDDDPSTPPLEGYVDNYYEEDEEFSYSSGTSWMQLTTTGLEFHRNEVEETPDGISSTYPEDGQWFCWRVCAYDSIYALPNYDFVSYELYSESEYEPIAAVPGQEDLSALPLVDGVVYAALPAAVEAARGGRSIDLPASSTIDAETKTITVGTEEAGSVQSYQFPAWYDLTQTGSSVTFALNALAAPTLEADPESETKPFSVEGDKVVIVPGNVINGLYYGLQSTDSLAEGFAEPTTWVRAENGSVVLEAAKTGTSGFYKVKVSDTAK